MADNEAETKIRYQMDVYFDSFPEIDTKRLADFINSIDPGEDPCEVIKVSSEELKQENKWDPSIRIDALLATLGDFKMVVLIHDAPSPAGDEIEYSNLPPDQKKRLAAHKVFAILNNMGGEEYRPYENLIYMYKMGMALCDQGAIGVGNFHTGHFFHRELLLKLLDIKNTPGPGGEKLTLWEVLRQHHEPHMLFMNVAQFESAGANWLGTRGFSFCGFPDFICRLGDKMKPDEICQVYDMLFDYLMENGPVIAAGHTIGPDEKRTYRFQELPEGVEVPYPAGSVLVLEKEKKKGWLF